MRLEPLAAEHRDGLAAAAADGRLWELWYTSVPAPEETAGYIAQALAGQRRRDDAALGGARAGDGRDRRQHALPRHRRRHRPGGDRLDLVRRLAGNAATSTPPASCCSSRHAFETLGCEVVGLRTDNFNFASQRAIEALGARRDGVLRHHMARRDGSVRDTVIYSLLASEWPDVRKHLAGRLRRHPQT